MHFNVKHIEHYNQVVNNYINFCEHLPQRKLNNIKL